MRSRQSLANLAISAGLVVLLTPAARPTRAAMITEAPTSVATQVISGTNTYQPTTTLIPGGYMSPSGASLLSAITISEVNILYTPAMKFDLSTLALGTQITSAFFNFTVASTQVVATTPSLNIAGFSSASSTVTLADFSAPAIAIGSTGGLGTGVTVEQFNVTAFLNSLLAARATNVGFTLTGCDLESM